MFRFLRISTLFAALCASGPGIALVASAATSAVTPENEAYAKVGSAIAEQIRLREFALTEAQFTAFIAGFRASYLGTPHPIDESTNRLIEDMQRRVAPAAPVTATAAVPMGVQDHRLERFMARARENYSMMLSSSGLLFRVQGGTGPRPRPDDTIIVNIAAKAPDGKTDLPQISAPNVRTKVAHLLPGLAEGVQMIALGGEGFFILPPHLSFGVGEWPPGLEPGMPLLYRLTLTDIVAQPLSNP